ncbi:uncharacterized protein LOC125615900 [Marmota marmota marmota]|uniref:uncharacterized protein LOC125615900 n=1 Tax=Marmota marmota marmota TaxID=9994 RepID=UPI0020928897|nr:uncharacterized protein LOC125615900 [Marmota marmota marmota]
MRPWPSDRQRALRFHLAELGAGERRGAGPLGHPALPSRALPAGQGAPELGSCYPKSPQTKLRWLPSLSPRRSNTVSALGKEAWWVPSVCEAATHGRPLAPTQLWLAAWVRAALGRPLAGGRSATHTNNPNRNAKTIWRASQKIRLRFPPQGLPLEVKWTRIRPRSSSPNAPRARTEGREASRLEKDTKEMTRTTGRIYLPIRFGRRGGHSRLPGPLRGGFSLRCGLGELGTHAGFFNKETQQIQEGKQRALGWCNDGASSNSGGSSGNGSGGTHTGGRGWGGEDRTEPIKYTPIKKF